MGDVTVELIDHVYNENVLDQQKFSNRYEISHEFTIPYYYEGESDSLESTANPPDLYKGNNSPKYIYETTWYSDINDPNTGIKIKHNSSKGASGFFDESFNGDESPYTVNNLVYTDITDGGTTDRLNIGKTTRVNFEVVDSDGDFTTSQLAVVAHGAVVESSQYAISTKDFNDVWTLETLRSNAGAVASSNVLINDYIITYVDSNTIWVQFDVTFTAEQKHYIRRKPVLCSINSTPK